MTVDEVIQGIRRAWEFIFPPVVRIASVLALTYYVSPGLLLIAAQTIVRLSAATYLSDPQFQKPLDFYGIAKILPIAFGILALALLDFAHKLLLTIGDLIPPSIGVNDTHLFVARATREQIERLWQRHRSAEHLYKLRTLLGAEFDAWDVHARGYYDHDLRKTVARAHGLFVTCKFLVVWVIAMVVTAYGSGTAVGGEFQRALVAISGLVVCALYALTKRLYSHWEQEYVLVELMLTAEPKPQKEGSTLKTDAEIEQHLRENIHFWVGRWWYLEVIDTSMASWAWRHLATRKKKSVLVEEPPQYS